MSDEEFNKLLAGPLDHPLVPFKITRLILALRSVVDATGGAGDAALRAHCQARQERDENVDGPAPDLGKCCACGGTEGVRNVLQLHRKAPSAGKGWGCVVCGLPMDGAVSVLCDKCLEAGHEPKFVCDGYPYQNKRVPIAELDPERFDHDAQKHADQEAQHGP